MTIQSWMVYLAFVLAATATPGPAVLFAVTNSTLHGWRKAVFSSLGNVAGLFCLGVVAVTGLGTILDRSQAVFEIVKYAGAVYLVYLGLKQILQKGSAFGAIADNLKPVGVSNIKVFIQAFGVAVSNPKAIVFLTALFPQFLIVDRPMVPQFAALISALMAFSFSFLMLYAVLAHKAKKWFANPRRMKNFSRTSGIVFVGFGVMLAASSKK